MLPSIVSSGHPDFEILNPIRTELLTFVGENERFGEMFAELVADAIEFVLDPVRTGRTEVHELDNVEKTFVGLKIEHFIRDLLDAPKGIRDLELNGHDVDVKNTLDNSWMIPPETYRNEEVCLVINSKAEERLCWLGLLLARDAYLNAPNRDGKRGVKSKAVENVLWLVEAEPYPRSRWAAFDMAEFRELRRDVRGGTKRIAEFFRRNLEVPVHRKVIQSLLFPAHDYMKRARGNGGARDVLRVEGIAVLSGSYHNQILVQVGRSEIDSEELIAVKPRDSVEARALISAGLIDP